MITSECYDLNWHALNQLAYWIDHTLIQQFLPNQIGGSWLEGSVYTPVQAVREDFLNKCGLPPPWRYHFEIKFGLALSKLAFPSCKLERTKVIGHYFEGTEHFTRHADGSLNVYKFPIHKFCDYLFSDITRLRHPNFDIYKDDFDGKRPIPIWELI